MENIVFRRFTLLIPYFVYYTLFHININININIIEIEKSEQLTRILYFYLRLNRGFVPIDK